MKAIAYKYADPTEPARFIYDEDDLNEIEREDPSLIVRTGEPGYPDTETGLCQSCFEPLPECNAVKYPDGWIVCDDGYPWPAEKMDEDPDMFEAPAEIWRGCGTDAIKTDLVAYPKDKA